MTPKEYYLERGIILPGEGKNVAKWQQEKRDV